MGLSCLIKVILKYICIVLIDVGLFLVLFLVHIVMEVRLVFHDVGHSGVKSLCGEGYFGHD